MRVIASTGVAFAAMAVVAYANPNAQFRLHWRADAGRRTPTMTAGLRATRPPRRGDRLFAKLDRQR